MIRVSHWCIQRPRTALCLAVGLLASLSPGLLRLELRTDGNALHPTGFSLLDPGLADKVVLLIETDHEDGIFNVATLALVAGLTERVSRLQWETRSGGELSVAYQGITSLATERTNRVYTGKIEFRPFLDPTPRTREACLRVREDVRDIQLHLGTLVSFDEQSTCVLIDLRHDVDRRDVYRKLHALIGAMGDIPERISIVGAPVAESLLGHHILEDLGVPAAWTTGVVSQTGHDGETAIFYALKRWIGRHVGLVPVAVLVMMIVFVVAFRSVAAAALPLGEVGACLIAVFSLMGWLDVPIYLTIAVMPIILTAIGVADEIHIFSHYRASLLRDPDQPQDACVLHTVEVMCRPVVKTSLTTSVGFLSFCLSSIGPVQAFGVFTAIGILFCMIWSLTVIPACLVLVPPRWFVDASRPHTSPSGWRRFGAWVIRRRLAVFGVAVIVVLLTPAGLNKLLIQDSWIDGFDRDSAFYRATQRVNAGFFGTHLLGVRTRTAREKLVDDIGADSIGLRSVDVPGDKIETPESMVGSWVVLVPKEEDSPLLPSFDEQPEPALITRCVEDGDRIRLETKTPLEAFKRLRQETGLSQWRMRIARRPILEPAELARICALGQFIGEQKDCAVGGILGPCDYIATTNYMWSARRENARVVPDDPDRIRRVWTQYVRVRGEARRREAISYHHTRCLLTVFLKNANFRDTADLIERIRGYERKHLEPHGITLELDGDVAASQSLINAIVNTQLRSLGLSLFGIILLTAILARSWRVGVLCVVPCALAILMDFTVMGWIGMPIGVATSMFAAMTLGIGVDFAIHLIEAFRRFRDSGLNASAAVIESLQATGPAILTDAAAVAIGFGILIFSQVPSNARLGTLVLISVVGCAAWTLFLIPAVLAWRAPAENVGCAES